MSEHSDPLDHHTVARLRESMRLYLASIESAHDSTNYPYRAGRAEEMVRGLAHLLFDWEEVERLNPSAYGLTEVSRG